MPLQALCTRPAGLSPFCGPEHRPAGKNPVTFCVPNRARSASRGGFSWGPFFLAHPDCRAVAFTKPGLLTPDNFPLGYGKPSMSVKLATLKTEIADRLEALTELESRSVTDEKEIDALTTRSEEAQFLASCSPKC